MKEVTISDLFKDIVNEITDLKKQEALLQESFISSFDELSECYKYMFNSALTGKDCCELSDCVCSEDNAESLRKQGFEVEEIKDITNSIHLGYSIKFNKKETKSTGEYEVWVEGYCCTGQSSKAQYLGKYKAPSFLDACREACICTGYPFEVRDDKPISWGYRMFDNEADARKTFG